MQFERGFWSGLNQKPLAIIEGFFQYGCTTSHALHTVDM